MEALFLKIFELAVTASYLIVAVILLRLVFKKMPRWIICLLWGLVALRLVCPVSVESVFSLLPEKTPAEIVQTVVTPDPVVGDGGDTVVIPSQPDGGGETDIPITVTPSQPDSTVTVTPPAEEPQVTSETSPVTVISYIWIFGVCAMAIYCLIYYTVLRIRVLDAVRREDGVWQSEKVRSPFILGVFRPRIYLPYGMNASDEEYVLAHERAHIRRLDHVVKPFAFLILCVYWFDPLVWVAYILLCRDVEIACDEKVIKTMAPSARQAYATALLDCCVNRRSIAACPLAFGESGVKGRIKRVMSYKKVAVWVIVIALILAAVVAVCFMTDPKSPDEPSDTGKDPVTDIGGEDDPDGPVDPIPDDPVDPTPDDPVEDPKEEIDLDALNADYLAKMNALGMDMSDIPYMTENVLTSNLLYVSMEKAILSGNFGLIVYDMAEQRVSSRLSYEQLGAYGIHFMNYDSAAASADGRYVYISYHNLDMAEKYPFVYDTLTNEISLRTQEVGTVVKGGNYEHHDAPFAEFSEVALRYDGGYAYLMFDNGMTADGKIVISDADGNLTFYPIFEGLVSGNGSYNFNNPCSAKDNVDASDPTAKTVIGLAEDFYENLYTNASNDLSSGASDTVADFLEKNASIYGFDGSKISNFTTNVRSLAKHSIPSLGLEVIELELYYSFNYNNSESLSAGIPSVYALYDTEAETVINIGISYIG